MVTKNRRMQNMISWLSRSFGKFSHAEFPDPLRLSILTAFAKMYRLNLAEAERPLADYKTLDALFTRRLKAGLRPVQSDWIHPVDGTLCANGRIQSNQAFQVKGWNYSIAKLLGEESAVFDRGAFLTYYLCPTDYHRVHSPASGEIVSVRWLQGQLWPVNDWSVNRVKELFCLNERVVLNYQTPRGRMAVVLVGATNVGQIEVMCDPELRTNVGTPSAQPYVRQFSPPKPVRVGDEIGVFHLGSTVVVLLSEEFARDYREQPRTAVHLGKRAAGV